VRWDTDFWSLTLSTYNKMKKRRDAWKEKTVKAKTSLRRKKKRITESRRSVINTSGNYAKQTLTSRG